MYQLYVAVVNAAWHYWLWMVFFSTNYRKAKFCEEVHSPHACRIKLSINQPIKKLFPCFYRVIYMKKYSTFYCCSLLSDCLVIYQEFIYVRLYLQFISPIYLLRILNNFFDDLIFMFVKNWMYDDDGDETHLTLHNHKTYK